MLVVKNTTAVTSSTISSLTASSPSSSLNAPKRELGHLLAAKRLVVDRDVMSTSSVS